MTKPPSAPDALTHEEWVSRLKHLAANRDLFDPINLVDEAGMPRHGNETQLVQVLSELSRACDCSPADPMDPSRTLPNTWRLRGNERAWWKDHTSQNG